MNAARTHMIQAGDDAPDFDLPATADRRASSKTLRGRAFVLDFYPKADTSGCTKQACDFQEALAALGRGALPVIGISRDPMPAIEAFAAKFNLEFPLATDEDGSVVEAYGVLGEKSMYGRTYMGIDRSTFLVDADGRIAEVWRKVRVPGHAATVLTAAAALAGTSRARPAQ